MALRGHSGGNLDDFIRTKFDPLLAVTKELMTKLRESEADRNVLERRVRRLEQQMDNWRAGTVIDVKIPDNIMARGGQGTTPYSGLADALDSIVTDNNRRNPSETYQTVHPIGGPQTDVGVNPQLPPVPNNQRLLFSAPERCTPREVWEALDFTENSYVELNVLEWQREEDLWLSLLRAVAADASVHEKQAQESNDALQRLRKLGADCLLETCKVEVVFTLRGVPGKDDAVMNPTGLRLVAVFVASIANAWKALEARQPEALGRIAVVMCGNRIGMNLRAGDRKFRIEPLK